MVLISTGNQAILARRSFTRKEGAAVTIAAASMNLNDLLTELKENPYESTI